ncbi:MAG: SPFH domain-containing protein [Pirellulales bacterium]
MSAVFLVGGLAVAAALVAGGFQTQSALMRRVAVAAAVIVLLMSFTLASFRHVNENQVGIVAKSVGWTSLPPGKIIATEGEMGPQAYILPPGWHPWYWPFIFNIDLVDAVKIPAGQIGLLTASDGLPLPEGTAFAPEWPAGQEKRMAQDAEYFLTEGGGYRGPQTTVLGAGTHRINTKLFTVKIIPVTTIDKAMVGVIKSNVGKIHTADANQPPEAGRMAQLVAKGERGIWREPYLPSQYFLNTDAHEVTKISTQKHVVRYTEITARAGGAHDETEIMVRTSDGFTFPVDVRVEYEVKPEDAPLLVATVADDQVGLRTVMNSAVRAIFRNNAESVKAIDYVQQRSHQETQSLQMLKNEMSKIGVTISGVRIGNVGNPETLGTLLKTQTDREIALQEQATYKEQQRAAAQKKELTRTEQEAEEEKRLATARYSVQIAQQDKEKRIIAAGAEAEAIKIQAQAQADAYQLISQQIGPGNAALIEVLKIVGERGIQITPRVMVSGGKGDTAETQSTALIGTMLDTMVDRSADPATQPARPAQASPAPRGGR